MREFSPEDEKYLEGKNANGVITIIKKESRKKSCRFAEGESLVRKNRDEQWQRRV
jgi:hypothetical protein